MATGIPSLGAWTHQPANCTLSPYLSSVIGVRMTPHRGYLVKTEGRTGADTHTHSRDGGRSVAPRSAPPALSASPPAHLLLDTDPGALLCRPTVEPPPAPLLTSPPHQVRLLGLRDSVRASPPPGRTLSRPLCNPLLYVLGQPLLPAPLSACEAPKLHLFTSVAPASHTLPGTATQE